MNLRNFFFILLGICLVTKSEAKKECLDLFFSRPAIEAPRQFKPPFFVESYRSFVNRHKTMWENTFYTNRQLISHRPAYPDEKASYSEHLGPDFIPYLKTLGANDHWIDMGAGEMFAQFSYLQGILSNGSQGLAKVTGVMAHFTNGFKDSFEKMRGGFSPGKVRVFEKYISRLSLSEIGQADLITDVFGPLSYDKHLDQTLFKYAMLLKPNGRLYAVFGGPDIQTEDGMMNLQDWILRCQGLRPLNWPPRKVRGMRILELVRTHEPLAVPKLILQKYEFDGPPHRWYRLGNGFLR